MVFFSHPADFTPFCTTEFMTFASMQEEFRALNCELLGLSIEMALQNDGCARRPDAGELETGRGGDPAASRILRAARERVMSADPNVRCLDWFL